MNRKGVTPIIATVLLLSISVAAVASASIFLGDVVEDIRSNIEEQLGVQNKQQNSELTIIYGYEGTNGNIWIDVRNEGSISLAVEENGNKLWNLYVGGKPATWSYTPGGPSGSNVVIDPQETIRLDTGEPFPSVGGSKTIQLNGQYGTSASIVCDNTGGETQC